MAMRELTEPEPAPRDLQHRLSQLNEVELSLGERALIGPSEAPSPDPEQAELSGRSTAVIEQRLRLAEERRSERHAHRVLTERTPWRLRVEATLQRAVIKAQLKP
jgi:hypothetical protein